MVGDIERAKESVEKPPQEEEEKTTSIAKAKKEKVLTKEELATISRLKKEKAEKERLKNIDAMTWETRCRAAAMVYLVSQGGMSLIVDNVISHFDRVAQERNGEMYFPSRNAKMFTRIGTATVESIADLALLPETERLLGVKVDGKFNSFKIIDEFDKYNPVLVQFSTMGRPPREDDKQ